MLLAEAVPLISFVFLIFIILIIVYAIEMRPQHALFISLAISMIFIVIFVVIGNNFVLC